MNKNFLVYQGLKLTDERRFKPGEYVVIAGGKVFRRGKTLEKYLRQARKKYPGEIPLVAKVPQKGVFIFFWHD